MLALPLTVLIIWELTAIADIAAGGTELRERLLSPRRLLPCGLLLLSDALFLPVMAGSVWVAEGLMFCAVLLGCFAAYRAEYSAKKALYVSGAVLKVQLIISLYVRHILTTVN